MTDPAIEAAQKVWERHEPPYRSDDLIAAAREMAKSVQELHRRVGGLRATVCEACQVYWPCETAKRVYPSEELGL